MRFNTSYFYLWGGLLFWTTLLHATANCWRLVCRTEVHCTCDVDYRPHVACVVTVVVRQFLQGISMSLLPLMTPGEPRIRHIAA